MITSEQMKAARALLRWEQRELAARSGVSLPTIKRLELKPGLLAAQNSTVAALMKAFDEGGVDFAYGEHPGVLLRRGAA